MLDKAPVRLAIIASEQLLPNIESVLALAANPVVDLAGVHICYTKDKSSASPARRLQHLLTKLSGKTPFSKFTVIEPGEPCLADPRSITAWMHRQMAKHPEAKWVLNATGGTKPMSAAFFALADDPRVHDVIYRDVQDGWFAWRSGPDGPDMTRASDALGLADSGRWLDLVPIATLVEAQFAEEAARVHTRQPLLTSAQAQSIIDHLDAAQRSPFRFAWEASAVSLPVGGSGEGILFEHTLHGVLSLFNFSETCHSLTLQMPDDNDRQVVRLETDLLVKHNGHIVILDLKLSGEGQSDTPQTDQIRSLATTTRRLGGLSARGFMLRPNWPADPGTRAFAEAMRVTLLDAETIREGFDKIKDELKDSRPSPPSAEKLALFLSTMISAGRNPTGTAGLARESANSRCIALDKEIQQICSLSSSNVVLIRQGRSLTISLHSCQSAADHNFLLAPILREKAANDPSITLKVHTSKSGKSCRIEIWANQDLTVMNELVGLASAWPTTIDWVKELPELQRLEKPNQSSNPAALHPGARKNPVKPTQLKGRGNDQLQRLLHESLKTPLTLSTPKPGENDPNGKQQNGPSRFHPLNPELLNRRTQLLKLLATQFHTPKFRR